MQALWSVMKNQKLLLLTLFFGRLLCMEQSVELGKRKEPDTPAQENNRRNLQPSTAQNSVLRHEYLLKNIFLDLAEADPSTLARVNTRFNLAWKKLLRQRWNYLKESGNRLISTATKLIESTLGDTKISYAHFRELYKYLLRLSGRPMPRTKPEKDITIPRLLLDMAQEAQDANLVEAWPKMHEAIVEATPAAAVAIPTEMSTPEDIRGWLHGEKNQPAIQQVTRLDLSEFELTCLPEEISLFTALEHLDLRDNELTEVNIPDTLTALQELYLSSNELTKVTIPDTLTALRWLELSDNRLTKVTIPDTLTALQTLWLDYNEFTEVNITNTLTALRELHLGDNRLTEVNIPDTLTVLQKLSLYDNQLIEVNIPATLNALRYLWLDKNQLTPESIRIPTRIRQRAVIDVEDQQMPYCG